MLLLTSLMTVQDSRRARLIVLVEKHGGMANLCEALGFARNDTARLTRIANANVRHERGGTPYVMGDDLARTIEEKLQLERGWMDTPPGVDLSGNEAQVQLLHVAERLEPYQVSQLIAIGETLADGRAPAAGEGRTESGEPLKKTAAASSAVLADTVGPGTTPAAGPTLAHATAVKKGGLLDPSKKKRDGEVHGRDKHHGTPGEGNR